MPSHLETNSRSRSTRKQASAARPLKRNAACHQCRKRKLEPDAFVRISSSDARRPCTACLRSHGHLVEHAQAGSDVPPYPECTYDEVTDITIDGDEGYGKLQGRIDELEGLLRDMTIKLEASKSRASASTSLAANDAPLDSAQDASTSGTSDDSLITMSLSLTPERYNVSNQRVNYVLQSPSREPLNVDDNNTDGSDAALYAALVKTTRPDFIRPPDNFETREMTHSGWSPHLPDPATTRKVITAFFTFHVHACRLFHAPTFLASLDLHPLDPRFPTVAVLHAICAIGSTFTAELPPPTVHDDLDEFPYTNIHGRWRELAKQTNPFGKHHAKLAERAIVRFFDTGDHLIAEMQTNVLLCLFYMHQSMWSNVSYSPSVDWRNLTQLGQVFRATGSVLRSAIPLGLTTSRPFKIRPPIPGTLGPMIQEPNLVPPAESIFEEEMRRNTFWLAYALDRQQSVSQDFALAVDDRDICQLLPVRDQEFFYGVSVSAEDRQWSMDKNVFLYHPPQQTDSFILYIKSAMLISQVKAFNVRYRGRHFTGDLDMYEPRQGTLSFDDLKYWDPRNTLAFRELDYLVSSYKVSFPHPFTMPVQNGTVDAHLYSALIAADLAMILLHDPHVKLNDPACSSTPKLLQAARNILELVYLISSTTYDASLLDHFAVTGWYFAGRVFVRFLHSAILNDQPDGIMTHSMEINDINAMLEKVGGRMSSALHYKRMLCDVVAQTCGEQYNLSSSTCSQTSPSAGPAAAYAAPVDTGSSFDDLTLYA
ncbi:hypothetical protein BC835DRAFT_1422219 [Cytidiella melzeri]|nr:hypothetical protein BC835DRAFT_1422219 [Cytidiella melzeri]